MMSAMIFMCLFPRSVADFDLQYFSKLNMNDIFAYIKLANCFHKCSMLKTQFDISLRFILNVEIYVYASNSYHVTSELAVPKLSYVNMNNIKKKKLIYSLSHRTILGFIVKMVSVCCRKLLREYGSNVFIQAFLSRCLAIQQLNELEQNNNQ